jgi:type VI secretion system protein ImpH
MLADYFSVPVQVESYQGQWLDIPEEEQTQLGVFGHLGRNSLAGQRVWNRQSRFRLCLGPLTRTQFESLLPDPQPIPERKAFFLLCQMTRVYAGSEFDFDVQLVLKADEVPELVLGSAVPTNAGPRLGWNTWLLSTPPQSAQGDAVFASSAQTHFSL